MASDREIPEEITTEILSRLPVKSLFRFKCVCKPLKSLVESSEFFKHHLSRSLKINSNNRSLILTTSRTLLVNGLPTVVPSLNRAYLDCNNVNSFDISKLYLPPSFQPSPEKVGRGNYVLPCVPCPTKLNFGRIEVAGSCYGLVLILCGMHHIAVCNPSIHEQDHSCFKILPCINYNAAKRDSHTSTYPVNYNNQPFPEAKFRTFSFRVFGFGYDCYSQCYKIVFLTPGRALVFRLTKDNCSWRMIDLPELEFPSDFEQDMDDRKLYVHAHNHGVAVNNHLHWNITEYDPRIYEYSKETILSFDLHNEVWNITPEPEESYQGKPYIFELGVLDGCLCLSMSRGTSLKTSNHLELWIMKEYGLKESWTKVCNLPIGSGIPLAHRAETQEYLLPGTHHGLGWYNPKRKTLNKVGFHGCEFTGENYYSNGVKMCVETFANPYSSLELTETSKRIYQFV